MFYFYIKAVNEVGMSAPSEVLAVQAAQEPFEITEFTTLYQGPLKLIVGWTAPHAAGSPITDYSVYLDTEGGLQNIASSTYGQTNHILMLSPDGSDTGRSFLFKVAAINDLGEGPLSEPYLVVAATVPDAPIQLTRNELLTSKEAVSFTWQPGTSHGGSPIIEYRVSFDQGSDSWIVLSTSVTLAQFTLN
jgi:titin